MSWHFQELILCRVDRGKRIHDSKVTAKYANIFFHVEYTITFNLCHENVLVYISKATLHTPFGKT